MIRETIVCRRGNLCCSVVAALVEHLRPRDIIVGGYDHGRLSRQWRTNAWSSRGERTR